MATESHYSTILVVKRLPPLQRIKVLDCSIYVPISRSLVMLHQIRTAASLHAVGKSYESHKATMITNHFIFIHSSDVVQRPSHILRIR